MTGPWTLGSSISAAVNRQLKNDEKVLRATRGERARGQVGSYYVITFNNWIVSTHVDLEAMGRKLGVLKPYEEVSDE